VSDIDADVPVFDRIMEQQAIVAVISADNRRGDLIHILRQSLHKLYVRIRDVIVNRLIHLIGFAPPESAPSTNRQAFQFLKQAASRESLYGGGYVLVSLYSHDFVQVLEDITLVCKRIGSSIRVNLLVSRGVDDVYGFHELERLLFVKDGRGGSVIGHRDFIGIRSSSDNTWVSRAVVWLTVPFDTAADLSLSRRWYLQAASMMRFDVVVDTKEETCEDTDNDFLVQQGCSDKVGHLPDSSA
jgi:hypothetical protein